MILRLQKLPKRTATLAQTLAQVLAQVLLVGALLFSAAGGAFGQVKEQAKEQATGQAFVPDYKDPKEYIVANIKATGIKYLDPDALVSICGIKQGDKIVLPGETVSAAIRKVWSQGLLSDISFNIAAVRGDSVDIELVMKERPRLSKFSFKGLKRSEANDLREKVGLTRGKVVTDAMVKNTQNIVRKHFVSKGYFNASAKIISREDSAVANTVTLLIDVKKGEKVRIETIEIEGNDKVADKLVKKKLKDTKEISRWRIFKPSRYIAAKYEKDKENLINYYNKEGYRDAAILGDSIIRLSDNKVKLIIRLEEGPKYYFGNITWAGNYLYKSEMLGNILGISKGDIYNQEMLEKKLNYNPTGADVSSLYMDDGYLFFRVTPTEVAVRGDSIDIEMRVVEGQQATINRIIVEGNTKTSDEVVMREIRTLPGQKFSRTDLLRTQREIAQLGYFDPEQIGINPIPNPATGTVDIKYTVAEKPSDQIQLSGGWGGFFGFVGTLGLVFNNFSAKKIGNIKNWQPLPGGDGQRVSINFQANGRAFQTYSASFTEPWLGGRRPNSFTVGFSRSVQNNFVSQTSRTIGSGLNVNSVNISLGRRLRFPDDYFQLSNSVSLQRYNLFNYQVSNDVPISNGPLNQFSLVNTLSRNSINNPIFPTAGSTFTLTLNATPPYSLFNPAKGNYNAADKFRFVEFHKWMFDGSWFTSLAKNLVLNTRAHFGFLGAYSNKVGVGPFERFKMGGSGITGFNFLIGYDIVGLRGYSDNIIGPTNNNSAGIAYNKYVTELRYGISTNPAATIYVLAFLEGGNNVGSLKEYNPFNIYRSGGVGVRIMMPAFGLLGVDYGAAFDGPKSKHNNFTFTIGQQIR